MNSISITYIRLQTYTHTYTHTLHTSIHIHTLKRAHITENTYRAPCGSVYTKHTLNLRKADHKKKPFKMSPEQCARTLALHGSIFTVPNEEFIIARARRWKHYMKLERPVCDRVYAPVNGQSTTRYPSDSGSFTPYVEEESLKK